MEYFPKLLKSSYKNHQAVTGNVTYYFDSFPRECVLNSRGEVDYKTMCRLDGSSYMLKQCTEKKVPGETSGTDHPKELFLFELF
jgi:hypothetical protein